jgi:hypothetical protein
MVDYSYGNGDVRYGGVSRIMVENNPDWFERLEGPKVEWRISHPGTGEPLTCASFDEAMDKWFEGFNVPYLVVDCEVEDAFDSLERVKRYFRDRYLRGKGRNEG